MKANFVRTSIDVPRDLHRKLREAAARKGCSARQLILAGIQRAIDEPASARPRRRLDLSKPLVPSRGGKITDQMIYDHIEFP